MRKYEHNLQIKNNSKFKTLKYLINNVIKTRVNGNVQQNIIFINEIKHRLFITKNIFICLFICLVLFSFSGILSLTWRRHYYRLRTAQFGLLAIYVRVNYTVRTTDVKLLNCFNFEPYTRRLHLW